MSSQKNKLTITLPYTILGVIMLCMVLTGCDLHEPTKLSQNRVQVEEEQFSDTLPISHLNDAALSGLAHHYRKHGDGPLELTVTYDPKSSKSNAMHASDEAARLSKALRSNGVSNVHAGILPVMNSGHQMNAMISYTAYNALAPKDCDVMPGVRDYTVDADEDYKLGCTIETTFARQIARPKDLKGQSDTGGLTDGRRSANTVEVYRTGVPNEPLNGESATDE